MKKTSLILQTVRAVFVLTFFLLSSQPRADEFVGFVPQEDPSVPNQLAMIIDSKRANLLLYSYEAATGRFSKETVVIRKDGDEFSFVKSQKKGDYSSGVRYVIYLNKKTERWAAIDLLHPDSPDVELGWKEKGRGELLPVKQINDAVLSPHGHKIAGRCSYSNNIEVLERVCVWDLKEKKSQVLDLGSQHEINDLVWVTDHLLLVTDGAGDRYLKDITKPRLPLELVTHAGDAEEPRQIGPQFMNHSHTVQIVPWKQEEEESRDEERPKAPKRPLALKFFHSPQCGMPKFGIKITDRASPKNKVIYFSNQEVADVSFSQTGNFFTTHFVWGGGVCLWRMEKDKLSPRRLMCIEDMKGEISPDGRRFFVSDESDPKSYMFSIDEQSTAESLKEPTQRFISNAAASKVEQFTSISPDFTHVVHCSIPIKDNDKVPSKCTLFSTTESTPVKIAEFSASTYEIKKKGKISIDSKKISRWYARDVGFSPDSRYFIAGFHDPRPNSGSGTDSYIWDAQSGKLVGEFQ